MTVRVFVGFVCYGCTGAASLFLQRRVKRWYQFITHPKSHQKVRVPRPRSILLSVDTDMANHSSLSVLSGCFCVWPTCPMSTFSFFFFWLQKTNSKWHCVLSVCPQIRFLQCPPLPLHTLPPPLSPLFSPRLSFFALHTWVNWHKVPRLRVNPIHPHSPHPPYESYTPTPIPVPPPPSILHNSQNNLLLINDMKLHKTEKCVRMRVFVCNMNYFTHDPDWANIRESLNQRIESKSNSQIVRRYRLRNG